KPVRFTSPLATVPGILGRADMPSAKKSLGSSGSYFGCTDIFWRQATSASAINRRAARSEQRAGKVLASRSPRAARRSLPRNITDLHRLEGLQKIPCLIEVEFRIAGLNHEKEFVARGLTESIHIKYRVVGHRQAIEREHAENSGKRR